jgi:tripartite-type tricarboxylate transporter receptor subunit TctC
MMKVATTMTSTLFTRRSLAAAAAAVALCGFGLAAHAQQRVIHVIVPFGTGAVQDTVARAFNNELGAALNASAIVENRAGAGGTVGAAIVARAPADGNTLVLAAASHNIAAFLYSKLPYDPLKDFVGVANVGNAGYVLAVASGMNVSSTADFIKEVKANPGKYNYASAGNGSATHLAMASFLAKAGLQMTHIPTKSTGEAVNEVLAGRVQAVISSSIGVMGFQDDARMKLLASTGQSRSPFLPKLRPWPRAACRATPSIRGSACSRRPARPRPRSSASMPRPTRCWPIRRSRSASSAWAWSRAARARRSSRNCCARTGMRWGWW